MDPKTANDGHKGQVSHSPKPKTAKFWCVLFTSSQSAFRFHQGINHAQHKRRANKSLPALSEEYMYVVV